MRSIGSLVLVLLGATLVGCDDDGNPTGPVGSVTGTWTLRAVDEAGLPAENFVSALVRPSGCDVQTLEGSTLTLRPGGEFTITFDLDLACDGIPEDREIPFDGTYDRVGSTVRFTTTSLIEFDATLGPDAACGGASLTIEDEVFERALLYCPS